MSINPQLQLQCDDDFGLFLKYLHRQDLQLRHTGDYINKSISYKNVHHGAQPGKLTFLTQRLYCMCYLFAVMQNQCFTKYYKENIPLKINEHDE